MYFKCNKEYSEYGDCPGEKLRDVYNENESLILSGHAYISPSSFHKYLRCPAAPAREWLVRMRNDFMGDYVNFYLKNDSDPTTRVLIESMREVESEAVQDGTRLHEFLEYGCAGNFKNLPPGDDFDYAEMRQALKNFEISDDFVDDERLVKNFWQIVDDLKNDLDGYDWWCSEVWLPLRGFNTWGTADIICAVNNTLIIMDLKTGRQEVKAEFNEQLLAYAVGALNVLGWDTFDTVNFFILGVRWQGSDWLRTVDQVKNWRDTVLAPKMKECYSFHPKANVGEHCMYCKAKLFCKEWTDLMLFRHGGGCFDDTGLQDVDSTTLVDRFMWAKQIERFQNAAKDEIALRFEGIDAIEDSRVQYVKPSPIKKYVDEEGVVSYIRHHLGDNEYLRSTPNISPDRFLELAGDDGERFVEIKGRRPYVKMA